LDCLWWNAILYSTPRFMSWKFFAQT